MTRWAPKEAAAFSDPLGILTPGGIFEPEVYFAINAPAGVVGSTPEAATTTTSAWGFVVTPEQMRLLAEQMGEESVLSHARWLQEAPYVRVGSVGDAAKPEVAVGAAG